MIRRIISYSILYYRYNQQFAYVIMCFPRIGYQPGRADNRKSSILDGESSSRDFQRDRDVTSESYLSGVCLTLFHAFFGRYFAIFASKLCDFFEINFNKQLIEYMITEYNMAKALGLKMESRVDKSVRLPNAI